ncbi:hypothetical protein V6N13_088499 [Hibiscus sabdariffa]
MLGLSKSATRELLSSIGNFYQLQLSVTLDEAAVNAGTFRVLVEKVRVCNSSTLKVSFNNATFGKEGRDCISTVVDFAIIEARLKFQGESKSIKYGTADTSKLNCQLLHVQMLGLSKLALREPLSSIGKFYQLQSFVTLIEAAM